MTTSKGLQPGNYVLDGESVVCIVEILADSINTMQCEGIPLEDIEGIPLSPEWVERLGFVLQPLRQSMYIKKRLKIWLDTSAIAYLKHEDYDNSYYIRPVNYVHEVQNLNHALTGETLTPDAGEKKEGV